MVIIGRGSTGAFPVVAAALTSRAHGLEVMGELATALMLAYATAEVADIFSQRHVPRLVGLQTREALSDRLAAYNALRFVVLGVGLCLSLAALNVALPATPSWTYAVLGTAVWSTMTNMQYALALAADDYLTIGIGPAIALAALFVGAFALGEALPYRNVWTLALALNVSRLIELAWVRRRQSSPGVRFERQALAAEWQATRFLLGQMMLSAAHVRLVVPLVALLAGAAAAGAFSIGLSVLAVVSMSAVAITVPAYRHATVAGPPADLAEAWRRTRPDFFLSLVVTVGLTFMLLTITPWLVTLAFDVSDRSVHSVVRLIVLSGLFEGLALFAVLWYHACFRDRALLKLSIVAVIGGWVALVVGNALADVSGIAWAFFLTRVVAVLLFYQPVVVSLTGSARHSSH